MFFVVFFSAVKSLDRVFDVNTEENTSGIFLILVSLLVLAIVGFIGWLSGFPISAFGPYYFYGYLSFLAFGVCVENLLRKDK